MKLRCKECGFEEAIPKHCGKEMHLESIKGNELLVCWMGEACGTNEIPSHHDKPMEIVE